jgi:hypothetical protein
VILPSDNYARHDNKKTAATIMIACCASQK